MRAVEATTVVWVLARFNFWISDHRGSVMRLDLAISALVLLYVVYRFGYEIGGAIGFGAVAIVMMAARLASGEIRLLERRSLQLGDEVAKRVWTGNKHGD
jgi:hypothetical protein